MQTNSQLILRLGHLVSEEHLRYLCRIKSFDLVARLEELGRRVKAVQFRSSSNPLKQISVSL